MTTAAPHQQSHTNSFGEQIPGPKPVPQETSTRVEYIIVSKDTGRADWSDELYPSKQAAVDNLCGPRQDYGDGGTDPRKDWHDHFEIRKVMPIRTTR